MAAYTKKSFEEWLAVVDREIAARVGGFTHEDLPDWDYRYAYDNGVGPVTAANIIASLIRFNFSSR